MVWDDITGVIGAPEFQWDKYDGDVGGDSDGDGQLWGPKLTETIANIYYDLGKI